MQRWCERQVGGCWFAQFAHVNVTQKCSEMQPGLPVLSSFLATMAPGGGSQCCTKSAGDRSRWLSVSRRQTKTLWKTIHKGFNYRRFYRRYFQSGDSKSWTVPSVLHEYLHTFKTCNTLSAKDYKSFFDICCKLAHPFYSFLYFSVPFWFDVVWRHLFLLGLRCLCFP